MFLGNSVLRTIYGTIRKSLTCGLACCALLTPAQIGGFITKSYLTWRWTLYLPSIIAFASGLGALAFQDESYPPVILVAKAVRLRRLTRNWGIHAKQEEVEINITELIMRNTSRPLSMLVSEPILLLITLYVSYVAPSGVERYIISDTNLSFIYGLLFLSLTAYDIIFGEIYDFELGVSGLPFLAAIGKPQTASEYRLVMY